MNLKLRRYLDDQGLFRMEPHLAALKIKNVLIVYRIDTPSALTLAEEVSVWLSQKGITCWSHPHQSLKSCPPLKDISVTDLVLVLGGDGTYLEAVRLLNGEKTPILGVNLGSLGFLTNVTIDNTFNALSAVLNGEMEMRPRSLLDIDVKKEGSPFHYSALNDVVIERGSQSQLLNLGIYSQEDMLITDLKADGLIFASPTGSTAYNLAAGGPILHPEVKAFTMTPVCAHSLTNRPTIFPEDQTVCVKLNNPEQTAVLTVDGKHKIQIDATDTISITISKNKHFLLRRPSHNYFQLLREKLKFGERS